MIVSSMLTFLRRRLKDRGEVWTDADLIEALNIAGMNVQQLVLAVDPEAYMQRTRQNIEGGQDRYPKPDGAMALRQLRYRTSTGEYQDLGDPITPEQGAALTRAAAGSTTDVLPRWSWFGRFITLHPTPSADVTDGLEWWTVPVDTVKESSDQFRCHLGLHNTIVNRATLILAPESGADVSTDEIRKQIAEDESRIPGYYRRTLLHDVPFSVLVSK